MQATPSESQGRPSLWVMISDPWYYFAFREVSMDTASASWPDSLVGPGRVHRDVYTDPAILDLGVERWLGGRWGSMGGPKTSKARGG